MHKELLEAIATREAHCKPFGEAVTISRAERDELVALAQSGIRYNWLRAALESDNTSALEALVAQPIPQSPGQLDAAIDAAMAKEQA